MTTRETPQLRLSCLINTACTTGYTDFLLPPPLPSLYWGPREKKKPTAVNIHQFPPDQLSMASLPIPVRLEYALMMKAHLTNRCFSQPLNHMMQDDLKRYHSDVPQHPTSLVTAPPLTADIYVGLELVCAPGITYRWGAAHHVVKVRYT